MTEIVLDHVGKTFEIEGKSVKAVDDISLRFPSGSFSALIGPSGCGKSTLLRLVADILAPSTGRITIGDDPPNAARLKHEIGFVFQEASLLPWRSVIDNIQLPLEIAGGPIGDGPRPENLVRLVGLSGFENAKPS